MYAQEIQNAGEARRTLFQNRKNCGDALRQETSGNNADRNGHLQSADQAAREAALKKAAEEDARDQADCDDACSETCSDSGNVLDMYHEWIVWA